MAPNGSDRSVKSDETLLAILDTLQDRQPASVAEVASSLGLAKSTVHDHLVTLERHDFVSRDDDGYGLGLQFLNYGIDARQRHAVFDAAHGKVDELAEATRERAWCVVEEHGEAVYLYGASGSHSIRTHERIGLREPLHCIAAGKAILAWLPESRVDDIVERRGLERRTDSTIADADTLYRELSAIRDQGFALNLEESIEGVHAVGAPIRDTDGSVFGSISIGGPANRLTEQRLRDELAERILGATNEIEINIRQQAP